MMEPVVVNLGTRDTKHRENGRGMYNQREKREKFPRRDEDNQDTWEVQNEENEGQYDRKQRITTHNREGEQMMMRGPPEATTWAPRGREKKTQRKAHTTNRGRGDTTQGEPRWSEPLVKRSGTRKNSRDTLIGQEDIETHKTKEATGY